MKKSDNVKCGRPVANGADLILIEMEPETETLELMLVAQQAYQEALESGKAPMIKSEGLSDVEEQMKYGVELALRLAGSHLPDLRKLSFDELLEVRERVAPFRHASALASLAVRPPSLTVKQGLDRADDKVRAEMERRDIEVAEKMLKSLERYGQAPSNPNGEPSLWDEWYDAVKQAKSALINLPLPHQANDLLVKRGVRPEMIDLELNLIAGESVRPNSALRLAESADFTSALRGRSRFLRSVDSGRIFPYGADGPQPNISERLMMRLVQSAAKTAGLLREALCVGTPDSGHLPFSTVREQLFHCFGILVHEVDLETLEGICPRGSSGGLPRKRVMALTVKMEGPCGEAAGRNVRYVVVACETANSFARVFNVLHEATHALLHAVGRPTGVMSLTKGIFGDCSRTPYHHYADVQANVTSLLALVPDWLVGRQRDAAVLVRNVEVDCGLQIPLEAAQDRIVIADALSGGATFSWDELTFVTEGLPWRLGHFCEPPRYRDAASGEGQKGSS